MVLCMLAITEIMYKEPIYFEEMISGNNILKNDELEKKWTKVLGDISRE